MSFSESNISNLTRLQLELKIIERGRKIFDTIQSQKPSLFKKSTWMGKVMEGAMAESAFKTNLFRFVDVFPCLHTQTVLKDHILAYLSGKEVPWGVGPNSTQFLAVW